jgi:3-oxoadipate enol-lactonase
MWRDAIAALKDRYSVVAFDTRGHGRSSGKGECSVTAAAQDLKALLDEIGASSCHLVGISTGGTIALTFAAQWPAMVRTLTLADSFARPVEGSAQTVEATAEAIAYVSMEEFGTQYAAETLLPATALDVQDELAGVIAKMNPKVYIQTMRSAVLGDFTAALAAVKVPTLVLIGEHDAIAPRTASEFIVQGIAGATLEVVPAAGHLSCLDNPVAFNAALGRFLDAH